MKPNKKLITINNNRALVLKLLKELVVEPRKKILKWSKITEQTPNIKIAYPSQHLASLITGMKGTKTGARGDDLIDGTEVKSCSRVDQLDKCGDCGEKVMRAEIACAKCQSKNIDRKDDSKWLFTIKSEGELNLLTKQIDRVFLLLADYPNFAKNDFSKICIQAYEIWPKDNGSDNFVKIMNNYFYKIYLEHIKKNPQKTPAPKNFWPYSYQFYLCRPRKVFSALLTEAGGATTVKINQYVEPNADRSKIRPEPMPINLLSKEEIIFLHKHTQPKEWAALGVDRSVLKSIQRGARPLTLPDEICGKLPLRDTDKITSQKGKYVRRKLKS